MTDRIRFHLDESVGLAIAEGLRRRGIDVTTTPETGLLNASDEKQLAHSAAEGRVLVAHDEDFLRLHAWGVQHSGIAYCHQRQQAIGEVLRALLLLWDCLEPEEMENHVEFL